MFICIIYKRMQTGRTLNNSEQDNDDKEEESDVKYDSVHFIAVTIRGLRKKGTRIYY